MESDRIIDRHEAGKILGLSPERITNLVREGHLACVRVESSEVGRRRSGAFRRYSLADVEAFGVRYPVGPFGKRIIKPRKLVEPRLRVPRHSLADAGFIGQVEAGSLSALSQASITRLVATGVVPSVVGGRGVRRIPRAEFEAWASAGCPRPTMQGRRRRGTGLQVWEVAERLLVRDQNVSEWIRSGRLKASRVGGGWSIDHADLETFLQGAGSKYRRA
jgi:excisionase family DNA binding protein